MTTTVSSTHYVSIPPEIAREFGILPGTRLDWAKAGDGVIAVKPLPSRAALARELLGAGRHLLTPGADPIGDLLCERAADDRRERADARP